ncbi:MAG: hypothetical protein WC730_04130 [Patescibacteria group bacterium]|jgi:3D (Asp-Asp-Asp) domain-containing protein
MTYLTWSQFIQALLPRLKLWFLTFLIVCLCAGSIQPVLAADMHVASMDFATGTPVTTKAFLHRDMTSSVETVAVATEVATTTQAVKVLKTYSIDVTAYTSTIEECDADPFITADGSTVADGIIAANFLPFKTKVRFPELFGDKVFEVHDRMNKRYWLRADVWMVKKTDMRKFGIHRKVTIEVVEWGDNGTQWAERVKNKKVESAAS